MRGAGEGVVVAIGAGAGAGADGGSSGATGIAVGGMIGDVSGGVSTGPTPTAWIGLCAIGSAGRSECEIPMGLLYSKTR
jgi:hypothetical protein